jgi:hypothetical protein
MYMAYVNEMLKTKRGCPGLENSLFVLDDGLKSDEIYDENMDQFIVIMSVLPCWMVIEAPVSMSSDLTE